VFSLSTGEPLHLLETFQSYYCNSENGSLTFSHNDGNTMAELVRIPHWVGVSWVATPLLLWCIVSVIRFERARARRRRMEHID
jgi:hypothetical protein